MVMSENYYQNIYIGPAWDGSINPRLMESQQSTISSSSSQKFITLTDFAWVDGNNKQVKIYLDFIGAQDCTDNDISLEKISAEAIEFSIKKDDKNYKIVLDSLHGRIDNVSVKKKVDKFIIILEKEVEGAWYELRKTKK
jgi:hypothetical protein